jgi:hypothetical protein
MISRIKRYLQVKRDAMRAMQSGDIDGYLRRLREMNELRRLGLST